MQIDLEDLAARVGRLEDLEAIHSAWRDYLFGLDSADYESLANVFTADAVLDMVGLDDYQPGQDRAYHGREEIIDEFYKPVIDTVAYDPVVSCAPPSMMTPAITARTWRSTSTETRRPRLPTSLRSSATRSC